MSNQDDTSNVLVSLSPAELAAASGGQSKLSGWGKVMGSGKSTGTGPSTPMEILDNPPRALKAFGNLIGVPPTGSPGEDYHPATANPDGSIRRGGFSIPPSGSGPHVPQGF